MLVIRRGRGREAGLAILVLFESYEGASVELAPPTFEMRE
jgi:hypothetical protein